MCLNIWSLNPFKRKKENLHRQKSDCRDPQTLSLEVLKITSVLFLVCSYSQWNIYKIMLCCFFFLNVCKPLLDHTWIGVVFINWGKRRPAKFLVGWKVALVFLGLSRKGENYSPLWMLRPSPHPPASATGPRYRMHSVNLWRAPCLSSGSVLVHTLQIYTAVSTRKTLQIWRRAMPIMSRKRPSLPTTELYSDFTPSTFWTKFEPLRKKYWGFWWAFPASYFFTLCKLWLPDPKGVGENLKGKTQQAS